MTNAMKQFPLEMELLDAALGVIGNVAEAAHDAEGGVDLFEPIYGSGLAPVLVGS